MFPQRHVETQWGKESNKVVHMNSSPLKREKTEPWHGDCVRFVVMEATVGPPNPGKPHTLLLSPSHAARGQHLDLAVLLQKSNETTNNSQAEDGAVDSKAGGCVVVVTVAATAASSVGVGVRVGVLVVARAAEGTLDLTATALLARGDRLELVAGLVNVVGAGNVKGATDVLESREFDSVRVLVNQIPDIVTLVEFSGRGWTYSVKLPLSLTAPKIDLTLGNPVTRRRPVLLAIRRPPPMEVMAGREMLVRAAFPTKDRSPDLVEVRLGAANEVKKLESKRAEPLTTSREGTSKLETLAMVIFAIQTRLGSETLQS